MSQNFWPNFTAENSLAFLAINFVNFISLFIDSHARNAKDDVLDEVEKCLRQSRKV